MLSAGTRMYMALIEQSGRFWPRENSAMNERILRIDENAIELPYMTGMIGPLESFCRLLYIVCVESRLFCSNYRVLVSN